MAGIDIHAHIYPNLFIDILKSCGHFVEEKETGRRFISETGSDKGHRILLSKQMSDIPTRLETMDKIGIDMEILSIGNPWISYVPSDRAVNASRQLNQYLNEIVHENPKRFAAVGVLPVTSPSSNVIEEMRYSVKELGMRGFMIGTHVFGKPIYSKEFIPIFEAAAKLGIPMYIHPLAKADVGVYYDRLIVTGLVFPAETTIAAAGLVLSGLFDRCPDSKIILSHLGGMIPFSLGRLERAMKTNPHENKLDRDVIEYFKLFYLDSISYYTPSLEYTADIWGTDKIMMGSDYPYAWGDDREKVVGVIENSKYSESEKHLMYSENAKKLFKL